MIDFGHGAERWVGLRGAGRKYVYWASGGREEAYDLAADPGERVNLAEAEDPPVWVERWRDAALQWERERGLGERSTDAAGFRAYPQAPMPATERDLRHVAVNDGRWAEHLPADHPHAVETFAEAFDRAILKETTLTPDKLSVASYLEQGGTLKGTAWADYVPPGRPTPDHETEPDA